MSVRDRLGRQLDPYRARHRDVRWTHPGSWHLTLLFLGSVEPERVPELVTLVDEVAHSGAPFPARVARGGGRVRGREGVAWLELTEGAAALIGNAGLLADRCPRDITAGPPPRRTPSAHLTVVRRADRAVVDALRTEAHGPLGVGWTVDRLGLVRSYLGREGARYETLYEATLYAGF